MLAGSGPSCSFEAACGGPSAPQPRFLSKKRKRSGWEGGRRGEDEEGEDIFPIEFHGRERDQERSGGTGGLGIL